LCIYTDAQHIFLQSAVAVIAEKDISALPTASYAVIAASFDQVKSILARGNTDTKTLFLITDGREKRVKSLLLSTLSPN